MLLLLLGLIVVPVALAGAVKNAAAPSISGTAQEGRVLQADPGQWLGGSTPYSYAYEWQRCDADGQSCQALAGAIASSYTATSADVGYTLRVKVVATDAHSLPSPPQCGSSCPPPAAPGHTATAVSAPSPVVLPAAPTDLAPPAVSGQPAPGEILAATSGTWASSSALSYAFQWLRCDPSGAACQAIASANDQSYAVQTADLGSTLEVAVTATNAGGQATASSAPTAVAKTLPPLLLTAPAISGTAQEGQPLIASTGLWSSQFIVDYNFQWQLCDAAGANCQDIAGASGSSYTPLSSDVGQTVRVEVQAYNVIDGSAAAYTASSATTTVLPALPVATAAPELSGLAQEGQTLETTNGAWSTTHIDSYGYRWQRSSDGQSWSDVAGATSASYTVQAADIGQELRAVISAENAAGSGDDPSQPTAVVLPEAPVLAGAPLLSGTAQDGQTLSVSNGAFLSSVPLNYAYQWQSSADGQSFQDIAGASTASYTLQSADVGRYLRVLVTAENAGGQSAGLSNVSGLVLPLPPAGGSPTISGTAQEGQTLSADPGQWTPQPTSYSYQWQSSSDGQSFQDVAGASAARYVVQPSDIGDVLRVVVTATNSGGSSPATPSEPTAAVVALPPLELAPPSVSGAAQEGQMLAATTGDWASSQPLSYSYQWQSCAAACSDITGATSSSYTIATADVGQYLRVVVSAENSGGQVPAASDSVGPVLPLPPQNTALPDVSGSTLVGQTLTTTDGSWSGDVAQYSYQWQSSTDGSSWADVASATAASYDVQSGDVGQLLRACVSAANTGGSTSACSQATTPIAAQLTVTALSAGSNHACALVSDGTVRCWGGLYGYGSRPTTVPGLTNVTQLVSGDSFSCALLADGTAKCWGYDNAGQLGNGAVGPTTASPVTVQGLTGATQIAAGENSACAVVSGGAVDCWGYDGEGALGNGQEYQNFPYPVAVSGLTGATAVSVGNDFACALLGTGSLECWGMDQYYQLGIASLYSLTGSSSPFTTTPVPAGGQGSPPYSAIAAGGDDACGLTSGGQIYCWGSSQYGEMGLTPGGGSYFANLISLTGASSLSVGLGEHNCAVVSGGVVKCWGKNSSAELGNGTLTSSGTPVSVPLSEPATQVVAGGNFSCALLADGSVRCWGRNSGQLGTGSSSPNGSAQLTPVPAEVLPLPPIDVTLPTIYGVPQAGHALQAAPGSWAFSPSYGYQWQSSVDGQAWSDIAGQTGQGYTVSSADLGLELRICVTATNDQGSAEACSKPLATNSSSASVTQLAVGSSYACALLSDGSVKCWGAVAGVPENGTPSTVQGLANVTQLAAGPAYACALLADSTVKCWGDNSSGQLGRGSVGGTNASPAAVLDSSGTLSGVTQIATGSNFACALLDSGAVDCWGYDGEGELGNGQMYQNFDYAVPVSSLSGAVKVAAGTMHACALLAAGTVKCWGMNTYNQLGVANLYAYTQSTAPFATTPVPVDGNGPLYTTLAAAGNETCGLTSDGHVDCWGDSSYDAFAADGGTGFTGPARATGVTNASALAPGSDEHNCALLADGTVKCWGYDNYGQVGNGVLSATSYVSSPFTVPVEDSAVQVAAGNHSTCALLADGSVQCWGDDAAGQLGLGFVDTTTATGQSQPQPGANVVNLP